VRLRLILQARRAGFTLKEIRDLFESYDKGGRDAQIVRALPMFKARLAALKLKRAEIGGALEALKAASDRMAVKLGVIRLEAPDRSMGVGEPVERTAPQPAQSSAKQQPLRDLRSLNQRHG